MSHLQYIGARYVPKWYRNSLDDSANWEVNVEYEPLTWVTSANNHLYLSKKTVPDNIGTPAQNTEYWLDMGLFTGQSTEILQDEIDDLDDRLTTAERSISTNASDITKYSDLTYFKGKKILIIGDSISEESVNAPNWVTQFKAKLNGIAEEVDNNSQIGRKMGDLPNVLATYTVLDYDIVIIFLGTNDFGDQNQIGTSYNDTNTTRTAPAWGNSVVTIKNKSTGTRKPVIFAITPLPRLDMSYNNYLMSLNCYRVCITQFAKHYGIRWINGNDVPLLPLNQASYTSDGLHITSAYATILCEYLMHRIAAGGDTTGVDDDIYVDLSSHLNSAWSGTLRYFINGDGELHIKGFLTATGTTIARDNPIATGISAVMSNGNPVNDYQEGILFTNDKTYPVMIFNAQGNLQYMITGLSAGQSISATTAQLSFDFVRKPLWCNVITDGMN